MKNNIVSLISIFVLTISYGQKESSQFFDIHDFEQKANDVEWLVEYDMIAWWTSDSVSAHPEEQRRNIGKEWFCFQTEDNTWHAVYGKYKNSLYTLAFHYTVDSTWTVKRSYDAVDTTILNGYSRAIITGKNKMGNIADSLNLAMNQFVRKNTDGTYQVWIFPAFQPNYYAVYGGEYVYTISADGNQVLKDDSYFQGKFKAYLVDDNTKEVYLNYSELEKPTVGGVFYVWYYKKYFKNIFLENKYYTTTAFKTSEGQYTWMHMELNNDKKSKEKKK